MNEPMKSDASVRAGLLPLSDADPDLIDPAGKSTTAGRATAVGMGLSHSDGDGIGFNKWGAALGAVINPSAFACMGKISEDIAGTEWRVVNRDTGKTMGDSSHRYGRDRLTNLLHDMTDREGGTNPFEIMSIMELGTGEVYWQLLYNRNGQITGIDWLNSLNTNPDTSRGFIHQFTYAGMDRYMTIPLHQMMYLRTRGNILSDYHGFGPMMAAVGSARIQIMQAAGRAIMSLFLNDGLPRAILSPDPDVQDEWTPDQMDYIQRVLSPGHSSLGKSRTLSFPYPFKANIFELPDVQKWAELLKSIEPDIFRAFGVPPQMVGDTTTPYQNSDENRKTYDEKIEAKLRRYASFINTGLTRRIYGEKSPVYFEFELGPFQHIDPQERVAAKDLFTLGLVDGNEVRKVHGYAPATYAAVRFDPVLQTWVRTLPDGSAVSTNEPEDLPGQPLFAPPAPEPAPEPDASDPEGDSASGAENRPASPDNDPEDEPKKSTDTGVVELMNYLRRLNKGKAGDRPFRWVAVDRETAHLIEHDLSDDDSATVKHSVTGWRRTLLARDGITDYADVEADALPSATKRYIETLQRAGVRDDAIKQAAQQHYTRVTAGRARAVVEYAFVTAAAALMGAGLRRDLDQRQFEMSLTALVDRALPQNLIAGYEDAGVKGHQITGDDEMWMSEQRETHHRFIWNLSGAVYSDNPPSEKEMQRKPHRWYTKTVQPAYAYGLVQGSGNALGRFVRGDQTIEPCQDCIALGDIVKPFDVWFEYFDGEMPPCDRTECGGFECGCEVLPALDAEETAGPLPVLHGPHFERSASLDALPADAAEETVALYAAQDHGDAVLLSGDVEPPADVSQVEQLEEGDSDVES